MWGEILKDGKRISEITGNYLGYLDFDNVRYWDGRAKDQVYVEMAGEATDALPSQGSKRTDGRFYLSYSIEEAQAEKERLENIQRNDRKLREAANKRRENGGPKHVLPTKKEEGEEESKNEE